MARVSGKILRVLLAKFQETNQFIQTQVSERQNNITNLTNIIISLQQKLRRDIRIEVFQPNSEKLTFLMDEINHITASTLQKNSIKRSVFDARV